MYPKIMFPILLLLLCVFGKASDEKHTLPASFMYGYASSATQVEGAVNKDGKSDSQWDAFTKIPGKIADGSDTSEGIGEYDNFEAILTLLKQQKANTYRLSVSWSRIIPEGIANSTVNEVAIDHYRVVFRRLLESNITPMVTLYHYDIPQVLNDAYGGLLNTTMFTRDFLYFADVAFNAFGDQVKSWTTFNEPSTQCLGGYGLGLHAPGLNLGANANGFRASLRCGHSMLISHAKAVHLFRTKYAKQNGKITMVNVFWVFKATYESNSVTRFFAQTLIDFGFGWFQDPLHFGDYPSKLKTLYGTLGWLPEFTKEEKLLLKGSTDFVGYSRLMQI